MFHDKGTRDTRLDRTVAVIPGIRRVSQPLQIVRFTEGSLRDSACHDFERYGNEQTHNFTTVFWPMAFIELTYALDKYAGVARDVSSLRFSFPFGPDGVAACVLGCVVGVMLPLVAGREDK